MAEVITDEPVVLTATTTGLLRTNRMARFIWIVSAIVAFFGIYGLGEWLMVGRQHNDLNSGISYLLLALFCARIALLGIALVPGGVRVRTFLWTYRWQWKDIESFDLLGTVYTPSLQVHLRDGRTKGVVGLAARTKKEEVKAHRIFNELTERLERENAHLPPSNLSASRRYRPDIGLF
jgi:hypothetical protein